MRWRLRFNTAGTCRIGYGMGVQVPLRLPRRRPDPSPPTSRPTNWARSASASGSTFRTSADPYGGVGRRTVTRMRLRAVLLGIVLLGSIAPAAHADPRWEFYTADRTRYESPWFGGAHRIMIPFGCTSAPYYSPDPRCRGGRGFHHGLDVAMPCGTALYAARPFRVVSNDSLGPAYGKRPLLLRNRKQGWDLVIGHTRRVYVREGQWVRRGTLFARAPRPAALGDDHGYRRGDGVEQKVPPSSTVAHKNTVTMWSRPGLAECASAS